MTKQQLEIFVLLAKTLNYTKTAESLHLSQPSVTYQIHRLEKELGLHLFNRSTRNVELTTAGKTFFDDCRDILDRLDNATLRARNTALQFRSDLKTRDGSLS